MPNYLGPVDGRTRPGGSLPGELGDIETLLADTGYFREANVQACVAAEVKPLIAMGRLPHHLPLDERFVSGWTTRRRPTRWRIA
jgi:hypothetical protein